MIDYLQLATVDQDDKGRRERRDLEIQLISGAFRTLSRTLQVPILSLAQLSRAVETRASKVPQLSDLRESGSIEQDANVVMFLNPLPEGEIPGPTSLVTVIVAKNRDGERGEDTLVYVKAKTRFGNVDTHVEDYQ